MRAPMALQQVQDHSQHLRPQQVSQSIPLATTAPTATHEFVDARPQASTQRRLQNMARSSLQTAQLHNLGQLANRATSTTQREQMTSAQSIATERAPEANHTGLPRQLKSGIEALSGMPMDHVRVNYNSSQPAQLNAHAYAQGSEIHVAPGQEQHLPHEAWHVVQQAQGRVSPTLQRKGQMINDDAALETEADVMGAKAAGHGAAQRSADDHANVSGATTSPAYGQVRQCKIGFEFQTAFTKTQFLYNGNPVPGSKIATVPGDVANEGKMPYYQGSGFTIEGDEGDLELVTKPFDETESGFKEMASTFSWMEVFANQVKGTKTAVNALNTRFASATPMLGVTEKNHIDLNVGANIVTDPQVTAGISLASLLPLAAALGKAPPRKRDARAETEPVLGQAATKENLVRHIGWKDVDAAAFQTPVLEACALAEKIGAGRDSKTLGYLFMLSLYCLGYSAFWASREEKAKTDSKVKDQGMEPFWAKLAVGMISRTNLADAFSALTEVDQRWFVSQLEMIGNTLGQAAFANKHPNEPELRDGRTHADYRVFGQMPKDAKAENYKSWFSIREWLAHLVPQQDRLGIDFAAAYEAMGNISTRAFSDHHVNRPAFDNADTFIKDKDDARATYKVKHPSDIGKASDHGGNRLDGLILEFRKLGAKIDENQWWAFASNFFKLVVLTNQTQQRRDEIIDSFIDS